MPDAPTWKNLTPEQIHRDKQARANSKLYRQHPTVTVWEYLRMSRAEQERINSECRQIERAKQDNVKDKP